MKSRYWFLLSVILFIAAAFFWHIGEEQRAAESVAKKADAKNSSVSPGKNSTSLHPAAATSAASMKKRLANSSKTNAVSASASSTNAPELYPHRLKNTTQTLEQLARNDHAILLRNALIDTGAEPVKIPDELRSKGDPGSYIVQARGVVDASFRAALMEANAEIISYVPNNAYLVRLPEGMAKLAGNKQVQSVLRYEPYYKLDTELLGRVMEDKPLAPGETVRVGLFPGQRDSAVKALKGKGQIISEDPNSSPFGPELIVASADLVGIANLPQVQEIEPYYHRELLNDLTRVRLGISSNSVTPANYLDLTGSNIWVNVNDTTIDADNPQFQVDRVTIAIGDGTDEDGHGTHVAGIIASSGVPGPTGDLTQIGSVADANFRGHAPSSSLISLDIFAPALSDAKMQITAGETNYIELGRQSPLISNNSWGYGAHTYNSSAASFDAAVRDALPGSIGSQPIAFVFAAGNDGDGGVPGTITSPATAKNVISVGAIENKRDLTNDIVRRDLNCNNVTNKEFLELTDTFDDVAKFSSRGNVGISQEGTFGRFKPDVVASGTFIASTRSQQFDEASYYSPLHVDRNVSPNLTLDPGATNNTLIRIPNNACKEGATMSLTIDAIPKGPVSTNNSLLIYGGASPKPSTVSGNLLGANSVTIDRAAFPSNVLGRIYYFDIVNTNDMEISYDLQTTLVLSNDFGTYFEVLSNLNSVLAPNYRFESGTSMSAPAISGMLALMQEFFEERFQITNSPAMMKALLINGSRALGTGYNRDASLNDAGWGLPDIRRIIPTNGIPASWPIQLFDQSTNLALATGERHDRVVTINDTNSPLRVTLVWTDPPGNPAVGVKLVNDLDLIVTGNFPTGQASNAVPVIGTNVYVGNNFHGGEFVQPIILGTNGFRDLDAVRDTVNNVENVYINGPLGAQYTVSVIAHRVNVNAVTAHTNGIVQDYALVISADSGTNAPFTVSTNNLIAPPNTNAFVTVVTNAFVDDPHSFGALLTNQRVGANSPLQNVNANNLTDGTNTQWAFYTLNKPDGFTNVAFLTFLPPNLSGATNTVPGSRRVVEADIDMYVSADPSLTNLNPAAIAAADKSLKRGGQELVFYTNRNDSVFYVGIKSEDQRASEFSFFAVASDVPFTEEQNGNLILHGIPFGGVEVPDGSPDHPGGAPYIMIATKDLKIGRVVVTNGVTHERIGDLMETLSHTGSGGENSVVLLNHSFPNGQETGSFTNIYDDSGLDGTDAVLNGRRTDGPGSLLDFVGEEAGGAWILTTEDNSLNSTGRVDFINVFIERALETNDLVGGNGFTISGGIPPNSSRALSFMVPPNATNMIIEIAPKEAPLDTVIRRGRLAPTRAPYVDKGTLISPPGAQLTVGASDTPPLTPGRYVLRLFNDSGAFVNFTGTIRFELDLTAASVQTYVSSGASLLDDAVTNSTIHVDRNGRVVSTEVSVRIEHPRVSDLVLHLVSPEGTRILLAENRGGLSTNGYGFSNLQTNVFPATTSGDFNANTNVLSPTLQSGVVKVDYDFFDEPDQLRVYYDGRRIYDSGMVSGSGQLSIPYGPGNDTSVVIIMNEDGNPSGTTMWNYTASVLSGDFVYATFSENTNLALVPIKFAIPPFATNVPGSNAMTFDSSYFETPTTSGTHAAPGTVDGWTVTTNSVDVVADATRAHRGTNFLALGGGGIERDLPTTEGKFYNLKFAYRRSDPSSLSSANIVLDGVFTNEFVGNPNWIVHSTSFVAPENGTRLEIHSLNSTGAGGKPVMWFDTFELTEGGDPNYFLPEESLDTLKGENAKGDWKLEIWDNRAGAPIGAAELLNWQLHLTFASTNATATTLTNATQVTDTVAGGEIKYFIVDVPIFATHATNVLVSGGGPLNLLFNQDDLPVGNSTLGDVTLLSGTANGTSVLTTSTFPDLRPGQRYFLGVQNANAAQTNSFTLSVTFDNTNNLVNVTPLTNAIPYSTTLPLDAEMQYYQYDIASSVSSITFQLFNLSGDADLVIKRNKLPTQTSHDFISNKGGTNDEKISIAPPPPGRYYLGVYGFSQTADINYTIMVTEASAAPAPALSGVPILSPSGFHVTANTIIGRQYAFDVSLDLVNWTNISTIKATANVTTFTDPTPPETQAARFYRLRLLAP